MGKEVTINSLEEMCDLMCDNKLPSKKPKRKKQIGERKDERCSVNTHTTQMAMKKRN